MDGCHDGHVTCDVLEAERQEGTSLFMHLNFGQGPSVSCIQTKERQGLEEKKDFLRG